MSAGDSIFENAGNVDRLRQLRRFFRAELRKEIAQVREINRALPFKDPIALWAPPGRIMAIGSPADPDLPFLPIWKSVLRRDRDA